MSATCGTVHCARREHLTAVLIKASLDLASEVDTLKVAAKLAEDENARIQGIVERTYDACEQLGEKIGEPEEKKPCQHVFVVADECVKCGAPEEETHL
jgi:hypothetical protein